MRQRTSVRASTRELKGLRSPHSGEMTDVVWLILGMLTSVERLPAMRLVGDVAALGALEFRNSRGHYDAACASSSIASTQTCRFDDGGWASAEAANVHLAQRGCRAATGKSPGSKRTTWGVGDPSKVYLWNAAGLVSDRLHSDRAPGRPRQTRGGGVDRTGFACSGGVARLERVPEDFDVPTELFVTSGQGAHACSVAPARP